MSLHERIYKTWQCNCTLVVIIFQYELFWARWAAFDTYNSKSFQVNDMPDMNPTKERCEPVISAFHQMCIAQSKTDTYAKEILCSAEMPNAYNSTLHVWFPHRHSEIQITGASASSPAPEQF